jgi:hypothetical protein
MQSKVALSIHNRWGQMVAYAGRAIASEQPKYKLPTGFHKSWSRLDLPTHWKPRPQAACRLEHRTSLHRRHQVQHIALGLAAEALEGILA